MVQNETRAAISETGHVLHDIGRSLTASADRITRTDLDALLVEVDRVLAWLRRQLRDAVEPLRE
jgi:hypothetical protein